MKLSSSVIEELPWGNLMFDSPEELLRKIRLGEDTSLEYKAVYVKGNKVVDPRRSDLADEIAAIANTADCVLVLGVENKTREIIGIPIEHMESVERYIYEVCCDSIEPPVFFRSYRIELPDSAGILQPILKVEIPRSLFVHKSPGGYFHRLGSSKREMSTEVLARLFQQRSQTRLIRFDEQPIPGTRLESLDEALWRRFLIASSDNENTLLHKMRILTKDESGSESVTVTGILLCSNNPQHWLPGAFIQAVRYRGRQQDTNYQIDAQEIIGTLDKQIFKALKFVRLNMMVGAKKYLGRIEIPQYSVRAVYEAVVNAVAHRDYSIYGSKIRLFMFDDRLELYSPGSLPNTVTVESIALRQSTRNELLTTFLAKCPVEDITGEIKRRFLMEKRGDGVPIIFEESKKLSGILPKYRLIDDAELLLTIYSPLTLDADDVE